MSLSKQRIPIGPDQLDQLARLLFGNLYLSGQSAGRDLIGASLKSPSPVSSFMEPPAFPTTERRTGSGLDGKF